MGFTRLTPSKPTIAAIDGWCLAGGLELALWCDLRIATPGSTFGCFERRWGVPLIDGGTQRLPRVVGLGRALDLILTGRPVDAEEAMRIGLVTEVVEPGEHLERALELAERLAAFPQETMLSDRRAALEGAGTAARRGPGSGAPSRPRGARRRGPRRGVALRRRRGPPRRGPLGVLERRLDAHLGSRHLGPEVGEHGEVHQLRQQAVKSPRSCESASRVWRTARMPATTASAEIAGRVAVAFLAGPVHHRRRALHRLRSFLHRPPAGRVDFDQQRPPDIGCSSRKSSSPRSAPRSWPRQVASLARAACRIASSTQAEPASIACR